MSFINRTNQTTSDTLGYVNLGLSQDTSKKKVMKAQKKLIAALEAGYTITAVPSKADKDIYVFFVNSDT